MVRGIAAPHKFNINGALSTMNIKDIENRKFSRSIMGYDISEVDEFLDEIAKDIERREQDIKLLELRNEMLIERLAAGGIPLASDKTE